MKSMVILISQSSKKSEIKDIEKILKKSNLNFIFQKAGKKSVFIVSQDICKSDIEKIRKMNKVEKVVENEKKLFLSSNQFGKKRGYLQIGDWKWQTNDFLLIAGPCAIEDEEGLDNIAKNVKKLGVKILRGGSFKPRTSPYSFQGLGEIGLKIHKKVCDRYGLFMISEVLDRSDLPLVSEYADIIQIGSRNMQNFPLLKAAGKINKPVLLKRNFGSTIKEFLLASEYILSEGNEKVVLCERGVRGFDPAGKNVFDPASLQKLKETTWLPVIVDPSHSAGDSRYVGTIAKSALVSGADGLMIEVHHEPRKALSDANQALKIKEFEKLVKDLNKIGEVVGKRIG